MGLSGPLLSLITTSNPTVPVVSKNGLQGLTGAFMQAGKDFIFQQKSIYVFLALAFSKKVFNLPALKEFKTVCRSALTQEQQRNVTKSYTLGYFDTVVEWTNPSTGVVERLAPFERGAKPCVSYRYDLKSDTHRCWIRYPDEVYYLKVDSDWDLTMSVIRYTDRKNPTTIELSGLFGDMRHPTDKECKMMDLLYGKEHLSALHALTIGMRNIVEEMAERYTSVQENRRVKVQERAKRRKINKSVSELKVKVRKELEELWQE